MKKYLLPLLLCPLVTSGCFSSADDAGKPDRSDKVEEITDPQKPNLDTPEQELVETGKRYFAAGMYTVARDQFEALRDGYPTGAYAEFAEIKIADTYFELNEFTTAATLYEELLKSHPASPSAPYNLLRAARSHHMANRGVGRDVASLQRARELYQQLIDRYGSSPYAEGAEAWLKEIDDRLAAYDRLVLEFYKRRDKTSAYEARRAEFVDRWGRSHEEVSLEAPAVVPTETVETAPEGLRAEAARPQPLASRTSPTPGDASATSTQPGSFVQFIECDRSQKLIFLHLSSPVPPESLRHAEESMKVSGAGVVFQVRGLMSPGQKGLERDCFGSKDVAVTPEGVVAISSLTTRLDLAQLSHPPRLMVTAVE